MSRAGRYAHEQSKRRHSQGGTNRPAPQGLAGATWLPQGMQACRELQAQHATWDKVEYAKQMGMQQFADYPEAESQLRYLSQLGFLHMSYSKELNSFMWRMAQPDLPTKEDLQ